MGVGICGQPCVTKYSPTYSVQGCYLPQKVPAWCYSRHLWSDGLSFWHLEARENYHHRLRGLRYIVTESREPKNLGWVQNQTNHSVPYYNMKLFGTSMHGSGIVMSSGQSPAHKRCRNLRRHTQPTPLNELCKRKRVLGLESVCSF